MNARFALRYPHLTLAVWETGTVTHAYQVSNALIGESHVGRYLFGRKIIMPSPTYTALGLIRTILDAEAA